MIRSRLHHMQLTQFQRSFRKEVWKQMIEVCTRANNGLTCLPTGSCDIFSNYVITNGVQVQDRGIGPVVKSIPGLQMVQDTVNGQGRLKRYFFRIIQPANAIIVP